MQNELNLLDISKTTIMKTRILLLFLIFSSGIGLAQTQLADKFFDRFAYIKASELYKNAYDKGDNSLHVLTRLGDCYYNNSNSEEAAKWYGAALNKYEDVNTEYVYKYIQTLRSTGKFDEAQNWMQKFNALRDSDSRAGSVDLSVFEGLSSTEDVYVTTKNLDINSEQSDFGTYINGNTMYFASSRGSDLTKKVYKWNDEPFLDIFQATINKSGDSITFSDVELLKSNGIDTPYHEATVSITNDGNTMYFTRDDLKKGNRLDHDDEGTSHLRIYRATLVNGIWDNIEDLPFNDDVSSTGHPALSPDNKKLYFVSDREGSMGQTDIYYVDINEDGTFGEPEALGNGINTEGREMFPFVDKNNVLYFSSDGHVNLGLLDIFKVDLNKENAEVENLGAPYNSGYDDFAYFSDEEGKGYFSSNRPNGKGGDDIYGFEAYECQQMVEGTVRILETGIPIAGAKVELIDKSGKVLETFTTLANGAYNFEIKCNQTYTIKGSKFDFKDDLQVLKSTGEHEFVHNVDLNLTPLIIKDQIVINPIFFDFDKWNIRTDAQYELEHIVDVMRNHPNMIIKIESHTDSRGSDRYNQKLSERRAQSTKDYILSRGIDPSRIESAKGFGESQLLNECSNGVKCSKEKHQENRRSYFYIIQE